MADFLSPEWFDQAGKDIDQSVQDTVDLFTGNSKAPDNDPVTGLSEVDVRHDPVSELSETEVWYGPVDDTYYDSITNPINEERVLTFAAFVARNMRGHDPSLADVMTVMEIWEDSGFLSALGSGRISEEGMSLGMDLHFLTQVAEGYLEMPFS